MNEYTKEDVAQELAILVKAGLVDIRMREDGEWVYFPTEYSKSLTQEELMLAIDKIKQDEE